MYIEFCLDIMDQAVLARVSRLLHTMRTSGIDPCTPLLLDRYLTKESRSLLAGEEGEEATDSQLIWWMMPHGRFASTIIDTLSHIFGEVDLTSVIPMSVCDGSTTLIPVSVARTTPDVDVVLHPKVRDRSIVGMLLIVRIGKAVVPGITLSQAVAMVRTRLYLGAQ